MLKATKQTIRLAVHFDTFPAPAQVRTGAHIRTYHAGNRPGERGPVVPSTRSMTPDQDRALLLLSAGHPIRISDLNAHMGAYSVRMIRAMRDLTSRGLAVFAAGAYTLAAVQS